MENEELYDEFDFSSAPDSIPNLILSDDEPRKRYNILLFLLIISSCEKRSQLILNQSYQRLPIVFFSSQPPGLSLSLLLWLQNKPAAVPTVTTSQSSSKESIEPVAKVLSPPPAMQATPVTKISGPSFASALAAATANNSQASSTTGASATQSVPVKSLVKQFSSGAFEELETFSPEFPSKGLDENVSKFLACELPESSWQLRTWAESTIFT